MLPSLNLLPTSARTGLPAADAEDSDSSSDSSSDSDSDFPGEFDEDTFMLHRSYLSFAVSKDPIHQSRLTISEFTSLDMYQVDALRDANDPLGSNKEMQGATRHFPCHVFWSKDLGDDGYDVWGRPTTTQQEEEAVIAMLAKQRKEREEFQSIVKAHKWQQECDRKCRDAELESSASRASQCASVRRASDAAQDRQRLDPLAAAREERAREGVRSGPGLNPVAPGRIANILHRIHRREGNRPLTTDEAETLINHGLGRLGRKALVLGGFALVSAVAYLQRLQEQPVEQEPDVSLLQRIGILESPFHLGASVNDTAVTRAKRPGVTDKCLSTDTGY